MGKNRKVMHVSVFAGILALLSGCAGTNWSPIPERPEPSASPSATPEPSPSPSEPVEPVERTAETPLESLDAYLACRSASPTFIGDDLSTMTWQSYEDSYVQEVDRIWRVYIEVVDTPKDGSRERELAGNCMITGTVGEPEFLLISGSTRFDPLDDSEWELSE